MTAALHKFFYSLERLEKRTGFNDVEMISKAKTTPFLMHIIESLSTLGYRYAGDTRTGLGAYTIVSTKRIYIGRNKSVNQAVLSLMYELTNARNAPKLKAVQAHFLSDGTPSLERAIEYAKAILYVETDAVLNRSIAAIHLGLESLIKNKAYLDIVKSTTDASTAVPKLHAEMIEHGTVQSGKKKALDFYVAQYFVFNQKAAG